MFTIPIAILLLHFIGDFIFQSDWMAINKSKNTREGASALGIHALVYSLVFLYYGLPFVGITFLSHLAMDGVTSRITSLLWKKEERHWFFVVIGFDQLIHYTTLAMTLLYLGI